MLQNIVGEAQHPGEYLRVRFLEPLGLTAAALARGCRIPRSRVSELLAGKRSITPDTAQRLAAFFRMRPEAWMALQAAWDLREVEVDEGIVPLDPPGFILGPLGATPIPVRARRPAPTLEVPEDWAERMSHEPSAQRPAMEHVEVRYANGTRALVAREK